MTPHERLERSTWDCFWVPDDVTIIDRPDLLVLYSPRPLSYLNTVYRTRAKAEQLPALINEVRALHRDVESRWCVVDTVETGPLEDALAGRGYHPTQMHDARVTSIDAFVARPASGAVVHRVADEGRLRDCWHVMTEAFGNGVGATDADIAVELRRCAAPDARVQRFVAYLDGEPVSSGGINFFPNEQFAFLWGGGTVPAARGKGAYSSLVAARMAHAKTMGARFVGLYAVVDTSSPIVAAQGFARVGRMTHWVHRL